MCLCFLFLFFFPTFWLCLAACGILVIQAIKPTPPTGEAWRLNHWTARVMFLFSPFILLSYINDSTPYKYIFHLFIFPSTPATRMDAGRGEGL